MLKNQGVSRIRLGTPSAPEIDLGHDDRDLFDSQTVVDEEVFDIVCDIIAFDKKRKSGKLLVAGAQPLPQNEYPFVLAGSQDHVAYIASMLKGTVTLSCSRELRVDPFTGPTVVRLRVLGLLN